MSWRAAVALLPVAALLGLLLYGVTANETGQKLDSALAHGRTPAAPALSLPRMGAAGTGSLAAYRGQVVVLNYWASWCVPCREEAPLLERWHKRIAPRRGTVLGVDALDSTPDARAFVREFHLTYPMLRDGDGHTQKAFGVRGYPETLVLDRRGRIAAIQRGPVDDAFLRDKVLPLL
jgi:cytochrome c biogenesis protein CcmG/thiol:disulfide interchange protein DsbE